MTLSSLRSYLEPVCSAHYTPKLPCSLPDFGGSNISFVNHQLASPMSRLTMAGTCRLLCILGSIFAALIATTTAHPTTPTPTRASTEVAIVRSPERSSVLPCHPRPAVAAPMAPISEVDEAVEAASPLVPFATLPPPTNANGPPDYDALIPAEPAASPRPTADLGEHGLTQVTYYSCATYATTTHCGWHRPLISTAAARRLDSGSGDGTGIVLAVAGIVVALSLFSFVFLSLYLCSRA